MDKNNATVAPDAPVPIEKTEKRLVQLDELSAADRALAEQFGYQPVCQCNSNEERERDREEKKSISLLAIPNCKLLMHSK